MREIAHGHGGMPGAIRFQVHRLDTGARLFGVTEANATEGWYDQFRLVNGCRVRDPSTRKWIVDRHHAPIKILEPVDDPELVTTRLSKAEAKRARQAARQSKSMAA